MIDFIDGVLEPALWFLADWSLRWGLLIVMLGVSLVMVRPRRSATRYLVSLLVLLAGLVLPALPRWGRGIASTRSNPALTVAANPATPESAGRVFLQDGKEEPRDFAPALTDHARAHESPSLTGLERSGEPLGFKRITILILAIAWMLGTVFLFGGRLGGWLLLERMRRTAIPLQGDTLQLFQACVARLVLRRKATLAAHAAVRSPITLGLHRPTILVPVSWAELPDNAQRSSLLHELAHLARYDDWSALALELVRTVFFFHPLVLWLLGRIEYERELLCDETVVALGIDARDYAGVLLEFSRQAGRLRPAFVGPAYPLGFGRGRTVKTRINRLLEANMNRWMSPLPVGRAIALGTLVLALSLALGSFGAHAVEIEGKDGPISVAPAVPQQERESLKAATPAASQRGNAAPQALSEPAAPEVTSKKKSLMYGGKGFGFWRAVLATDLKAEVRIEAIKALSAFGTNGYDAEASSAIIEAMRGYDLALNDPEDEKVFGAAMTALSKIGDRAVVALAEELQRNIYGRRFAILALTNMGPRARSAAPAVIEAIKNDDLYTRRTALAGIERIGPDRKLLIPAIPALSAALKDPDVMVRVYAARELARLGQHGKPAVPALIATFKDDKNETGRRETLSALRTIGPKREEILPALLLAIKDKDFGVRGIALKYLEALGPEAEEAVPALIVRFKEAAPDERYAIVRILGSIGPAAKEAVPTLIDFQPQGGNERMALQDALKKISK